MNTDTDLKEKFIAPGLPPSSPSTNRLTEILQSFIKLIEPYAPSSLFSLIHKLIDIAKSLLTTAVPSIINGCTLYSSSFVSGLFISQLGIEYIATISYANRFRYMFMIIPSYLFWGIQNTLKKAFKSQDETETPASLILASSLLLMIPLSGISMVLLSQSGNILRLLGANADDIHLVDEYFKNFIASVPAYMFLQLTNQTLYSSNRSLYVIPLSFLRAVLDISLTYTFLQNNMGFSGWPLASTIQSWTSVLIVTSIFLSRLGKNLRDEMRLGNFSSQDFFKNCTENLKPGFSILLQNFLASEVFKKCIEILKVGLPIILQNFTLALGGLFLTLFAGEISQQSLAAFSIVGSVAYWSVMLSEPFATASCLVISEKNKITTDIQEKKLYAIKTYFTAGTIALLFNLPLSLTMIAGYKQLAGLYLNPSDSKEEMNLLSTLLPLYALMGPLYAFKYTATGLLRTQETTLPTFYVELVCSLVIGVTGGAFFTFSAEKSIIGVGASEITGTAVAMISLSLIALRAISKADEIRQTPSKKCWNFDIFKRSSPLSSQDENAKQLSQVVRNNSVCPPREETVVNCV